MMPDARLNVVHICDHLGWEGSRMHGVKRLFAWMIPRFDTARFNVSLISLRRKDLSEDTLEQFGIDVTYLARHKFDPATLPGAAEGAAGASSADVLHMHGYGATTFGRLCAWRMGHPVDPARAREPRRHAVVPEGGRSAARAAHRPRDRRVGIDGGVHDRAPG